MNPMNPTNLILASGLAFIHGLTAGAILALLDGDPAVHDVVLAELRQHLRESLPQILLALPAVDLEAVLLALTPAPMESAR